MTVKLYGDSDIGRVRRVNEDSYRLIPERDTVVVCDGMGGHAAGEIASNRAAETVAVFLTRGPETTPITPLADTPGSLPPEATELVWAIRLANRRVYQIAQAQKHTRGMGTTLVAARFISGSATVCHVGDSRAYLLRDGKLQPLTTDHSLVAELLAQNEITAEQARTFPDRNIITRALGTRPVVSVDLSIVPTRTGDWYVLCSDGLCGLVEDRELEEIALAHPDDPRRAMEAMIDAANRAGGHDNITVAIAAVSEDGDSGSPIEAMTIPESDESAAQLELSILEGLFNSNDEPEPPDADTDRIVIPNSDR